jgi:uncharacterized membrane protein
VAAPAPRTGTRDASARGRQPATVPVDVRQARADRLELAPRPHSTPARTQPDRRLRHPRSVQIPWALAAMFLPIYAALSILRHRQMLSAGLDLGVFEQAVQAYAHGHLPIVPLKGPGFDLLGDHFSPIIATLAPFYRIFPGPVTLLVAQALLAALAIVPLARWAQATRGPGAAVWVGLGQGCSWGVVQMVDFDFHEVAFAVPLLAFALAAAGERRWRAAVLWALPLVLVKEDLGLTVAALGCYIACKGPRRTGIALALFGALASALETLVVLPALSGGGRYTYADQIDLGHGLLDTALAAFEPSQKWYTVFVVLAPTGLLALRSPLALLITPTLAWRFLSDNPDYWGTMYHYDAVLMPIVFAAALDTLTRPRARAASRHGIRLRTAAMVFGCFYTAYTVAVYPLHDLALPSTWSLPPHTRSAQRLLALVPDGAHVASSNRLAAQLVHRAIVTQVCPTSDTRISREAPWIILDATDPSGQRCPAFSAVEDLGIGSIDGYRLVARADGITLLHRS